MAAPIPLPAPVTIAVLPDKPKIHRVFSRFAAAAARAGGAAQSFLRMTSPSTATTPSPSRLTKSGLISASAMAVDGCELRHRDDRLRERVAVALRQAAIAADDGEALHLFDHRLGLVERRRREPDRGVLVDLGEDAADAEHDDRARLPDRGGNPRMTSASRPSPSAGRGCRRSSRPGACRHRSQDRARRFGESAARPSPRAPRRRRRSCAAMSADRILATTGKVRSTASGRARGSRSAGAVGMPMAAKISPASISFGLRRRASRRSWPRPSRRRLAVGCGAFDWSRPVAPGADRVGTGFRRAEAGDAGLGQLLEPILRRAAR